MWSCRIAKEYSKTIHHVCNNICLGYAVGNCLHDSPNYGQKWPLTYSDWSTGHSITSQNSNAQITTKGTTVVFAAWAVIHSICLRGKAIATHLTSKVMKGQCISKLNFRYIRLPFYNVCRKWRQLTVHHLYCFSAHEQCTICEYL